MRYNPDDFRIPPADDETEPVGTDPKILTPAFPTPPARSTVDLGEQYTPAPKPSQRQAVEVYAIVPGEPTPFGGYWCACRAGVVMMPHDSCVACKSGWTPAAAEIERLIREYPKS